jgi:methyl-accepting chemotaxis protein
MMRKTIREKLTFKISLTAVILFVVITFIVLSVASDKIIIKEKEILQLKAEKCSESINTWINKKIELTENTANAIVIKNDIQEQSLRSIVELYAKNHPDCLNLYYGTESNRIIMSDINLELKVKDTLVPTQRDWYKLAKEAGKTIVQAPYVDFATSEMCITIASPVYVNNKLEGVLGADILLTEINEMIEEISNNVGVYGFAIDENGNYMTHKNDKFKPTSEGGVAAKDAIPELAEIIKKPWI